VRRPRLLARRYLPPIRVDAQQQLKTGS